MLLPTLGKMRSEASYIFRLRFGILRILALLARLYAPAALKADQSADFIHLTDGANVTITAYIGTNTAVMIPDTIIGLPVTSIGNKAFFPTASPVSGPMRSRRALAWPASRFPTASSTSGKMPSTSART
jgi:hypothetical protein